MVKITNLDYWVTHSIGCLAMTENSVIHSTENLRYFVMIENFDCFGTIGCLAIRLTGYSVRLTMDSKGWKGYWAIRKTDYWPTIATKPRRAKLTKGWRRYFDY